MPRQPVPPPVVPPPAPPPSSLIQSQTTQQPTTNTIDCDHQTKDPTPRSEPQADEGYVAIKFDKESLDLKASLGLTSLSENGVDMQLNELDLSK